MYLWLFQILTRWSVLCSPETFKFCVSDTLFQPMSRTTRGQIMLLITCLYIAQAYLTCIKCTHKPKTFVHIFFPPKWFHRKPKVILSGFFRSWVSYSIGYLYYWEISFQNMCINKSCDYWIITKQENAIFAV